MSIWFTPWVGNNYHDGGIFGKKILVIGNNHYCTNRASCACCGVDGAGFSLDNNCYNFTSSIIEEYLAYKNGIAEFDSWMNTFSHFQNALDSKSPSCDIWNSLAFYNYLQTAINNDNNKTSSNAIYSLHIKDYHNSEECLWDVISQLMPDYIIIWGSIIRNHVGEEILKRTKSPVLFIRHPSIGFSTDYWHNVLSNFLNSNNNR